MIKKIKDNPLPAILKGVGTASIWRLGFYLLFELRLSFLNMFSIDFLIIIVSIICGVILRSNSWLLTFVSWLISVLFSLMVLFPLMIGIPPIFHDSFYLLMLYGFLSMYVTSTFIPAFIIMLVSKFIQKKRAAKKAERTDVIE